MTTYTQQLIALVKNDFRGKYQHSTLGFLWSLLKPILLILILYLVFSNLNVKSIEAFPLYLIIGVVAWNHFATTVNRGTGTLVEKRDIIKNISFQRSLITNTINVSEAITLIIFLAITLIIAGIIGYGGIASVFLIISYIELVLISSTAALVLSVLYVKFRDLSHIVEVLLSLGFFITPIFYDPVIIPEAYRSVYYLNPFTRIITEMRTSIIGGHLPDAGTAAITLVITIIISLICLSIYRTMNKHIVEDL